MIVGPEVRVSAVVAVEEELNTALIAVMTELAMTPVLGALQVNQLAFSAVRGDRLRNLRRR